jgi:hypothetical protein
MRQVAQASHLREKSFSDPLILRYQLSMVSKFFQKRYIALLTAIATFSLLFSGCASPSRISLDPAKKANIRATQGIVGIGQQEIVADIVESNMTQAAGGGLLFAIIDASVNNSRGKKAESAITPVRDALIGYDVGKTLSACLNTSLATTSWLKLSEFTVRQINDPATVKAWLPTTSDKFLFLVRPTYELDPTFSNLVVSAFVTLDEKPLLNGSQKPIYENRFSCLLPLPNAQTTGGDRATAAKLWAANSGAQIRKALDTGLSEIAAMIAYDLEQANPPEKAVFKAPSDTEKRVVPFIAGQSAVLYDSGYVTRTVGDRVWVRIMTGQLSSSAK